MHVFYFGLKTSHVLLCIRLLFCSYLIFSEGDRIQTQIKTSRAEICLLCHFVPWCSFSYFVPFPLVNLVLQESPWRSPDTHKYVLIVFLNSKWHSAFAGSSLPGLRFSSPSPLPCLHLPPDVKVQPNHFAGSLFGNHHTFPSGLLSYGLKEHSLFICNKPITEIYWRKNNL